MVDTSLPEIPRRTRGIVVELLPTPLQASLFAQWSRARRRVRNCLVRLGQRYFKEALWRACKEHALKTGEAAKDVRARWSDPENRKTLKAEGFSYEIERRDYYKVTTPWINFRQNRWMLSMPQNARKEACQDFRAAERNFFASLRGVRKGKRIGRPTFESRRSTLRWSVQLQSTEQDHIRHNSLFLGKDTLKLPKEAGHVRCRESIQARIHGGRVMAVTIWKDVDRWCATIRVSHIPYPHIPRRNTGSIGVDLNTGIHGVVLSTGERFPVPPKLQELHYRIREHQRLHRHKLKPLKAKKDHPRVKPSHRWIKQNEELKRLYQEQRRIRKDWLERVTTRIARSYATVVIEDLDVAALTRSAKGTIADPGKNVRAKSGLNRVILDASFGEFRRLLTYKLEQWHGQLVIVDRWFPSSQLCSRCGSRPAEKLKLDIRIYSCEYCGMTEDRDRNAARNLRRVYEDSIAAHKAAGDPEGAAAHSDQGGERPAWTGEPLIEGKILLIKFPGKPGNSGRKRERSGERLQFEGGDSTALKEIVHSNQPKESENADSQC